MQAYSTVLNSNPCFPVVGIMRAVTKTQHKSSHTADINPLNAELNPICYLLALLGAQHFLHVSRIRVKSLAARIIYINLLAPEFYI